MNDTYEGADFDATERTESIKYCDLCDGKGSDESISNCCGDTRDPDTGLCFCCHEISDPSICPDCDGTGIIKS